MLDIFSSKKARPPLLRYAQTSKGPLARNGAHKFAAKHALQIYNANAIYSFIPKNACTTMRLSLSIANGCIGSVEDFRWIHENNGTFAADLRALVTASYTFVILRCPFARLASCYVDKIVEQHIPVWALLPQEETEEPAAQITFRRFVEILHQPGKLKVEEHWRPQADFLVYSGYDDAFAFEDMSSAADTLKAKIGLELIDARPLTKHGLNNFERISGEFADLPAHEIAAMKRVGRAPALSGLYDQAIIGEVSGLYARDIELYQSMTGRVVTIEAPKRWMRR